MIGGLKRVLDAASADQHHLLDHTSPQLGLVPGSAGIAVGMNNSTLTAKHEYESDMLFTKQSFGCTVANDITKLAVKGLSFFYHFLLFLIKISINLISFSSPSLRDVISHAHPHL